MIRLSTRKGELPTRDPFAGSSRLLVFVSTILQVACFAPESSDDAEPAPRDRRPGIIGTLRDEAGWRVGGMAVVIRCVDPQTGEATSLEAVPDLSRRETVHLDGFSPDDCTWRSASPSRPLKPTGSTDREGRVRVELGFSEPRRGSRTRELVEEPSIRIEWIRRRDFAPTWSVRRLYVRQRSVSGRFRLTEFSPADEPFQVCDRKLRAAEMQRIRAAVADASLFDRGFPGRDERGSDGTIETMILSVGSQATAVVTSRNPSFESGARRDLLEIVRGLSCASESSGAGRLAVASTRGRSA